MRHNRMEHEKSQSEWCVSVARQQHRAPHRAARVARRTRLANGLLENSVDMPSISMGFFGKKKGMPQAISFRTCEFSGS